MYFHDNRSLMFNNSVVFSFKTITILFLVEVGITLICFNELTLFVTFSFEHFKVEFFVIF